MIRRSTIDMVVSNKALAAKGLSPDQPLADRLRKLKGLRFGITAPQTATDSATRYLLKQGGYNPDTDAQIIRVGSFAGQTAALESDQIDAFVGPPPVPKQVVLKGEGKILVSSSAGEVPGLANYYFANLTMRSDFVAKNPAATRAYVKSMREAYAWMVTHRDGALKSVEKRLPSIDPATIALGYDEIFVTFSPDGRFTPAYVASTLDVLKQGGVLESPPSAAEGVIWTNQYNQ
jgi:ABC-type nitrate/sulfonate/bicarbonate transport system substrate-binding protein